MQSNLQNMRLNYEILGLNDSTLVLLFHGKQPSLKLSAGYQLLSQVIKPLFFKSLRTDQQLGYVVGVTSFTRKKVPHIAFYTQSPKVGPQELEQRFKHFIKEFDSQLSAMSESDIAAHKEGLINKINKKETMLVTRSSRYNRELAEGFTQFDKREQLTSHINLMTKNDLLQLLRDELINNPHYLISRNLGKAHEEKESQQEKNSHKVCKTPGCFNKNAQYFKSL